MKIDIRVFEDVGGRRPDITPDALAWLQANIQPMVDAALPWLAPTPIDILPRGDLDAIHVLLCARETMDETFDFERALGAHLIDTPDADPFGDGTPYAKAYRVAVVVDRAEIEARLAEEMEEASEGFDPREAEIGELTTIFHEIVHVMLFAANSNFNAPQTCETAYEAGDIQNDLFDLSSGYGLRALPDEFGEEIEPECAADARDRMEKWCEMVGRRTAALAPWRDDGDCGWFEALGVRTPPPDDAPSP